MKIEMTLAEYNNAIDLFADDIYRFALRCCSDKSICEDAVQEAFAALWEQHETASFDNCKSFLLTVARRKLIDSIRHNNVRLSAQSGMTPEIETVSNPFDEYDLNDAITKAFEQLTDLQRTILTLHDMEGYDYREIADITSMNYKSVQVATFRARMKMKKILTQMKIR